MEILEFKKVARLLKEVYAELEKEALSEGMDIFGEEYRIIRDALRERVLAKMGFTLEEYRVAKELVAPAKKVNVATQIENVTTLAQETSQKIDSLDIPDENALLEKARTIAEAVVKPPVIQTNVVERTIVEKPTVVKETVTVNKEFDANPIYAELGYLNEKIDSLEIPETYDPKELLDQMRSEFGERFKENIDTLGMPDFRKLAMGLQAQIDEVRNTPTTGGSGITRSVVVTTGNTILGATADTDYVCIVNGAHTVTMPTAVGNVNQYTVKNNHSADITINTTSSQTIDGTTSIEIAPEDSVDIVSTGTAWCII